MQTGCKEATVEYVRRPYSAPTCIGHHVHQGLENTHSEALGEVLLEELLKVIPCMYFALKEMLHSIAL